MEKVLVRTNDFTFDGKMRDINDLMDVIVKKIIPAFNELGIGEITTELLQDAVIGNCSMIEGIAQKQARNDTKSIKTPSIKDNMLMDADRAISTFKQACFSALQGEKRQLSRYLTVNNDGLIELSQSAAETIKDECRYYITEDREIEAYKAHLNACEAINKFLSIVEIQPMSINSLFIINAGTDKFEPAPCNYDLFFNPKAQ